MSVQGFRTAVCWYIVAPLLDFMSVEATTVCRNAGAGSKIVTLISILEMEREIKKTVGKTDKLENGSDHLQK